MVNTLDPDPPSCGIFGFKPKWMQSLATPRVFMINFALLAIVQGTYFTYLIGSVSTMEKRFAYDSSLTGFILIADNLSQLALNPVIGYLGTRMNKARIMAVGMFVVSFASMLTALPFFIYGRNHIDKHHYSIMVNSTSDSSSDASDFEYCSRDGKSQEECNADGTSVSHATVWPAYIIIWMSSFLYGLGQSAFYTLGLPYVDDNVSKRNAPLYFCSLSCIRLLGPVAGFVMSSVFLSMYEDPFHKPNFGTKDPRWIGAWWLGFLVIGFLILITSLPMFFYPAHLKAGPKVQVVQKERKQSIISIKNLKISTSTDVKQKFMKLMRNRIFMFDTISRVFAYVGYGGYFITQPKYIESQYGESAAGASLVSGTTTSISMAGGIMIGGLIIWFFRPGPRALTVYTWFVGLFCSIGFFSGLFFGCPSQKFVGELDVGLSRTLGPSLKINENLNSQVCSMECGCTMSIFQPVCSMADNSTNYFSPCYADCSKPILGGVNNSIVTGFSDCGCDASSKVSLGFCKRDCGQLFKYYLGVVSLGKLIASTGFAGNILVKLRCVDDTDKSFAMGISKTILSLFGSIPYPLLFGYITDKTCMLWEYSCGQKGNCWFYDQDKFRNYLHITSFSFMLMASFLDLFVIYFANDMKNLYGDDNLASNLDLNHDQNHVFSTNKEIVEKSYKQTDKTQF